MALASAAASPPLDPKYTKEVIEQVKSLLQKGAAKGERVSTMEAVFGVLQGAGLSWVERVPPELVGTHPQNRSGLMLDVAMAHEHGAEILKTGWSTARAADATAVEAPPDSTKEVFLLAEFLIFIYYPDERAGFVQSGIGPRKRAKS